MFSTGFEPSIPGIERLKTYSLDRRDNGIDNVYIVFIHHFNIYVLYYSGSLLDEN